MTKSTFLCLVMILEIVGTVYADCPPGWLHHGNSCYFFSNDILSWDLAQDVCKGFHGYLAEVETQSESDYIEAITKQSGIVYWLGGKDDVTEGHWYWATSQHPFEYADWYPGEPNNRADLEDCLQLLQHWNDSICGNEHNFICERSFTN